MSKIREKRCAFIRTWTPQRCPNKLLFPAEELLWERIDARPDGEKFFVPFSFPNLDNHNYHFHLNFIVDALELLPEKVDLSFDVLWKAFESLLRHRSEQKQITTMLSEYCSQWDYEDEDEWSSLCEQLMQAIPMQSAEYLVQRLFTGYSDGRDGDDSTGMQGDARRIWNRMSIGKRNEKFLSLWRDIAEKYQIHAVGSEMQLSLHSQRAIASLFKRYIFVGAEIKGFKNFSGKLTCKDRMSILVLGLLYTFRNARFHGTVLPPFKSSKATLQTYAHANYAFLATYFLFLKTLQETEGVSLKKYRVVQNLRSNIGIFVDLYGKDLFK